VTAVYIIWYISCTCTFLSLSLVVVVHHVYDTRVSKDMLVWSMTRCLGCMDQGMSSFIEEQRYGHVAYVHFCLVL